MMSDSKTPAPADPQPKAVKPKLPKEQSLVLGILGARARGKKQYGKAKDYLQELRGLVKVGKVIQLADGRRFRVVDNFAGDGEDLKKMTFFDRFELEAVK